MEQAKTVAEGQGQGVVSCCNVRLAEEVTRVFVPGQGGQPEPQVHLVREGGVVKSIEIVCGCGQRLRLKCLYS